jgi:hypothetical protein
VCNVTEVTQFHTNRWGAIWGAIIARHGATRGVAEPHKSATDLLFSHVEPHRPTRQSSFASRESDSVTETATVGLNWSNPPSTPAVWQDPHDCSPLARYRQFLVDMSG